MSRKPANDGIHTKKPQWRVWGSRGFPRDVFVEIYLAATAVEAQRALCDPQYDRFFPLRIVRPFGEPPPEGKAA